MVSSRHATRRWDGGYAIAGALGHGDSFVCRDPVGIRPCYYLQHKDYLAAASERAAETAERLESRGMTLLRADGDGASRGVEPRIGGCRSGMTLQFGHRRRADRGRGGRWD